MTGKRATATRLGKADAVKAVEAECARLRTQIAGIIEDQAEDYNRLVRDQTQVWLRHDAFLDLGFWGRLKWLVFGQSAPSA